MLTPGDIVGGRYRLDALLGVGSFGCVFRSRDLQDEGTVALKVLRVGGASALRRFKREFRSCAQLVHPNLIRLYALSQDMRGWLLAMEYVDGCALDNACLTELPGLGPSGPGLQRRSDAYLSGIRGASSHAGASLPLDAATLQLATATPLGSTTAAASASLGAVVEDLGDVRRARARLVESDASHATRQRSVMTASPAVTLAEDWQRISAKLDRTGEACSHERERVRESRELRALLEAFGGLAPAAVVEVTFEDVLRQLAAGIDAIHCADLIHGDIKPANVVVRRDGRVKILDFGLAAIDRSHEPGTGRVVGTARYMAPELSESGMASPASDWYALAVTGVELMFGWAELDAARAEHPGEFGAAVRALIGGRQRRAVAGIDAELVRSLVDCLDPDPRARMQALRRGWFRPFAHERLGSMPASWRWPLARAPGSGEICSAQPRIALIDVAGWGDTLAAHSARCVDACSTWPDPQAPERLERSISGSWSGSGELLAGGGEFSSSGDNETIVDVTRVDGFDDSFTLGAASASESRGVHLFGRDHLLREIRALRAQGPVGAGVVLAGASGIGKTSVSEAFVRERRGAGDLVLVVRCLDDDRVPMATFDALIDAVADELDADPQLRRCVASLPVWPQLMMAWPVFVTLHPANAASTKIARGQSNHRHVDEEVVDALAVLISAMAAGRGVLVFIDDVQWADEASVAPHVALLRRLSGLNLFHIATQRSDLEDACNFVARIERGVALAGGMLEHRHMEVCALDDDSARAMLVAGLGLAHAPLDPGIEVAVQRVVQLAIGLPWGLVQWAMTMREALRSGEAPVTSLEDLIDLRMSTLGRHGARWMLYLACSGPGLSLARSRALLGPEVHVERLLADLMVTQLVERRVVGDVVVVRCRHARLGMIIERWLERDNAAWATVHRELGIAFLCSPHRDVARALEHLQRSGAGRWVREFALRSARRASRKGRLEVAARLYGIAAEQSRTDDEYAVDRWMQARCLETAGYLERAGAIAARAMGEIASEGGEGQRERLGPAEELALLRVRCAVPTTNSRAGVELARELSARVGITWPSTARGALLRMVAESFRAALRGWFGAPVGYGASQLERDFGQWRERVATVIGLSFVAQDFGRSAYYYARVLREARPESDPVSLARSLAGVSYSIDMLRLPHVGGLLRWQRDLVVAHRRWELLGPTLLGRSMIAYSRLDFIRALKLALRARRAYEKSGDDVRVEYYYAENLLMQIYDLLADIHRVEATACMLEFDARGMDDPAVVRWSRLFRGYSALARGDIEAASTHARNAGLGFVGDEEMSLEALGHMRLAHALAMAQGRVGTAVCLARRDGRQISRAGLLRVSVIDFHCSSMQATTQLAVLSKLRARGLASSSVRHEPMKKRLRQRLLAYARRLTRLGKATPQARALCYRAALAKSEGDEIRCHAALERAVLLFAAAQVETWAQLLRLLLAHFAGDEQRIAGLLSQLAAQELRSPLALVSWSYPGLVDQHLLDAEAAGK